MSKKRAAQRSYAEWDRLVDEWELSGQKQSEFAKAQGINASTFQGRVHQSRKRRGLGMKDKPKGYQVVEVTTGAGSTTSQGDKCRVTVCSTQIEFSSTSDMEWIAAILANVGHGK